MSESEKLWYYNKDSEEKNYGPYTDDELVRLIRQKILGENDRIWMMDLEDWLKIGDTIYSTYIERN